MAFKSPMGLWHLDCSLSFDWQFTKERKKGQPALSPGDRLSSKKNWVTLTKAKEKKMWDGKLGEAESWAGLRVDALATTQKVLSPRLTNTVKWLHWREHSKFHSKFYFHAHLDQANSTLTGASFLRPRLSLKRSQWLQSSRVERIWFCRAPMCSLCGSGTLKSMRKAVRWVMERRLSQSKGGRLSLASSVSNNPLMGNCD